MRTALTFALALIALSATAQAASVVVQPGESLSLIAKRELGSGKLWRQLCDLNKASLPDCNNLPVGSTILIAPEPEVGSPVVPVSEDRKAQPAAEGAAPQPKAVAPVKLEPPSVEEARTNLLAEASDFTTAYWTRYVVKPSIEAGKADPDGNAGATQLASADNADSGYSGILHAETIAPGTYTVGLWLRSTSGEQTFRYGVSDSYMAAGSAKVGEEWQYFQAVIEVDKETNRLFQVYENKANNPAWEIYGVSVEKGAFTTPFSPTN